MDQDKLHQVARFFVEEEVLSPSPTILPVTSRRAEWNEAAQARANGLSSIAWKFRNFNPAVFIVWLVGIGICSQIRGGANVFAGAFGGMFFARMFYRAKVSPQIVDIQDPSSPIICYPVEIVLIHKKTIYGEDQGIVSFVDGWLVYEGEDCAFSLKASDVEEGGARPQGHVADAYTLLTWHIDEQKYTLGLRPKGMRSYRLSENGIMATPFGMELLLWRSGSRRVEGSSLLPPMSVHPGVRSLFERALAGTNLLCLVGVSVGAYGLVDQFYHVKSKYLVVAFLVLVLGVSFHFIFYRGVKKLRLVDAPQAQE